jgi:predicted ester cyclase
VSNIDTVQTGMRAFCAGDTATLGSLLADDFTFSGPVPQPLDKAAFLGLCVANHTAFPDFDFHARDIREEGDKVYLTSEITGTHKGVLAMIPGVPAVPPTGKPIHMPAEDHVYTLRSGLLASLVVHSPPDGGVPAAYAQVGAPLP